MKIAFLVSFLYLISPASFGQIEFKNSNNGRIMNFEDLNGRSLLKKYDPDVAGSPFLNDEWLPAKLTFFKGNIISPVLIKFNLESNELYFKDSTGREMIALEGLVKRIDFLNASGKDSNYTIFEAGYPAIDKQNQNYFYQLLAEGRVKLLVKKSKQIETDKNLLSGEIRKQFSETTITFYIFKDNEIIFLRPNKNALVALLKDREELITAYINTNKINFKKIPDLVKVIRYYNGN